MAGSLLALPSGDTADEERYLGTVVLLFAGTISSSRCTCRDEEMSMWTELIYNNTFITNDL